MLSYPTSKHKPIMKTILIIDDNATFRLLLAEFLLSRGFSTLMANSGLDGFKLAQACHPDIIFCDVNMPGIDGFKVLQMIRSNLKTVDIPFFFVTAESTMVGQPSEGANGLLRKPLDFYELNRILDP